MRVEACLSSKYVQSLPPTVFEEDGVLDTAASAARVELGESWRIAFVVSSDAMRALCSVYDRDFLPLTESQEMNTIDSLFGNLDRVFTDFLLSNVRREAVKASSKPDVFH